MTNKFLTESGWKAVAQKFKVKDNGLLKCLSVYEKLANDYREAQLVERLKALASVSKLAGDLKKIKEGAIPEVSKYLTEIQNAAEADRKHVVEHQADKAKTAAAEKAAATPPKPDPKMLDEAFQTGHYDGIDGVPSRRNLFAAAPEFQKRYDEGYKLGTQTAAKLREKYPHGPPKQTSISPISKGDRDRSVEYTKRKKLRKEFIQYLNKWWKTRLPEDL